MSPRLPKNPTTFASTGHPSLALEGRSKAQTGLEELTKIAAGERPLGALTSSFCICSWGSWVGAGWGWWGVGVGSVGGGRVGG